MDVQSRRYSNGSESDESDNLGPNDEGWEDVEADTEALSYFSLFDAKSFPDMNSMIQYMRKTYGFDLVKTRNDLDLDFFSSMKLVNYIRSEVQKGNKVTHISSKDAFADDKYLQPVLADDAVLFSLEDLETGPPSDNEQPSQENGELTPEQRILDLESKLEEAKRTIETLKNLSHRLLETQDDKPAQTQDQGTVKDVTGDDSYFNSYAFRDIHETMLKDKPRTDAYRDFVYDNKEHFKGKTVLDVGCGTAILSMMCARAGAKRVIAVDNSSIIQKARANVFANGLDNVVTCIHGKIEEIELPVENVDIIISEWMGYALLYEAMLDSVLWARDRWLVPGGMLIPCDMYLCIAPLADPNLVMDKISFWNDVYGFDMTSMQDGIFDDVMLMDAQETTIASDLKSGRHDFLHIDLYTAKATDLEFSKLLFSLKTSRNIDALDGFVIWFDTIFGREDRGEIVNELSTGPHAPYTHWMQTILMANHMNQADASLEAGQCIRGSIGYERPKQAQRQLAIHVEWEVAGTDGKAKEKGKQTWKLE